MRLLNLFQIKDSGDVAGWRGTSLGPAALPRCIQVSCALVWPAAKAGSDWAWAVA